MKRPAFQFYPSVWRNSAKLRLCSWGARGAWIEVIGLMHDNQGEYGVLRATLKQIALAIGCSATFLAELARQGVMKGSDKALAEPFVYTPFHAGKRGEAVILLPAQDGPIWFSSRMVRDEHLRLTRGVSTRFGSPNAPPTRREGERQGEPPSPRPGYGALALSLDSSTEGSGNSTGQRAHDGQSEGKYIPLENQTRPPSNWRRDPNAAERYGQALGLPSHRGEELPEYVARLDAHLAAQRQRGTH